MGNCFDRKVRPEDLLPGYQSPKGRGSRQKPLGKEEKKMLEHLEMSDTYDDDLDIVFGNMPITKTSVETKRTEKIDEVRLQIRGYVVAEDEMAWEVRFNSGNSPAGIPARLQEIRTADLLDSYTKEENAERRRNQFLLERVKQAQKTDEKIKKAHERRACIGEVRAVSESSPVVYSDSGLEESRRKHTEQKVKESIHISGYVVAEDEMAWEVRFNSGKGHARVPARLHEIRTADLLDSYTKEEKAVRRRNLILLERVKQARMTDDRIRKAHERRACIERVQSVSGRVRPASVSSSVMISEVGPKERRQRLKELATRTKKARNINIY